MQGPSRAIDRGAGDARTWKRTCRPAAGRAVGRPGGVGRIGGRLSAPGDRRSPRPKSRRPRWKRTAWRSSRTGPAFCSRRKRSRRKTTIGHWPPTTWPSRRYQQALEQCKLVKEGPRKEEIDQGRASQSRRKPRSILRETQIELRQNLLAPGRRGALEEHRAGRIRGPGHAGRHRGRHGERLAAGVCRRDGPGSGEVRPTRPRSRPTQVRQGLRGPRLLHLPSRPSSRPRPCRRRRSG